MNAGKSGRKLEVPAAKGTWQNVFTGETVKSKAGELPMKLEGYGFAVFKRVNPAAAKV
jgi:hypothetical protein